MRGILIPSFFMALSFIGCSNSEKDNNNSAESLSNSEISSDTVHFAENQFASDTLLLPFRAVVDTLNSAGENLVHSDYFLHDISGNGQPELWIVTGSCEADKKLRAYQLTNDSVKKILDTYADHTEFFLNGQYIGSFTCHMGEGCVRAYTYKDGKILAESVEYDGWNEDEPLKIKSHRDKAIADIWRNSDSNIQLKHLK